MCYVVFSDKALFFRLAEAIVFRHAIYIYLSNNFVNTLLENSIGSKKEAPVS